MKNLCFLILGLSFSMAVYAQDWISLNSGTSNHLNSICFPDTNIGYAVGDYGTILKTTDGGLIWTSQFSDDSYHFNAVSFIDPDTGYIVGYRYLTGYPGIFLKTTDGGLNWINQDIDTTYHFGAIQLLGADTIFIIGSRILKTFDGGINWSVLTTPEGGAFWACNSNIFYLGCNHIQIYNTTDGGINWISQIYAGWPGDFYEIRFSNYNYGLAVGGGFAQGYNYDLLYYTRDGNDWIQSTYQSDKDYRSVFFTDDTTAYAVGTYGSIIKTVDAGENFTDQISGTSNHLNSVFFIGSDIGYIAGNNGTILKTSSGPLGLAGTSSSNDLVTIYPTPFQDNLSIEIDRMINIESTTLAIYNAPGLLLFEKEVNFHHTVLDLQSLKPGFYFLIITNPDHQFVIKLIKDQNP